MEDALVHGVNFEKNGEIRSLNPCFNGRCTSTFNSWPLAVYNMS